jgi:multidrug efflux system membrane fusion protein
MRSRSFRRGPALILLAGGLFLSGCGPSAPPEPATPPAEVSRPAPILEITGAAISSGLRFPGRVRAVQRVELAFNVPGQITEFPAQEGSTLPAGGLIARLDDANFQTRLAATRAEFENARAEYERFRRVYEESQAVARADVEKRRTAMEVARSSYAAAQQDVEDTRLVAPFAGVIARRYAENFENVQAKEPVVSLQNVDDLEIVIHVPERIIRSAPRRAAGYARFEDIPDRRFPVTLESYAAEADPQTQTYEVVLGLKRPQDVTILPGMSAEILPEAAPANAEAATVVIPLQALGAGPDGEPRAWVVDPETSRVTSRPIVVGDVSGSDIVVLEGLGIGDRIVTAGLGQLRDGMLVRPL